MLNKAKLLNSSIRVVKPQNTHRNKTACFKLQCNHVYKPKERATALEQLILGHTFRIRTWQWKSQPDMMTIHEQIVFSSLPSANGSHCFGWLRQEGPQTHTHIQLSGCMSPQFHNQNHTIQQDSNLHFTDGPACCDSLLGYNYTTQSQALCPLLWQVISQSCLVQCLYVKVRFLHRKGQVRPRLKL